MQNFPRQMSMANTVKFTIHQCIVDLIQIIKNANPHTRAHARESFIYIFFRIYCSLYYTVYNDHYLCTYKSDIIHRLLYI